MFGGSGFFLVLGVAKGFCFMLLRIVHNTRYLYATPVTESKNEVRLMPLTDDDQTCRDFQLRIVPFGPIRYQKQPGGTTHFFNVDTSHRELQITAESRVETWRTNPYAQVNLVEADGNYYGRTDIRQNYAEFLMPTRLVPAHPDAISFAQMARAKAGPSAASFLIALTGLLREKLTYEPGATHARTTLDQFLQRRRGVCQDFAHLMLAVCRSQHIPARYVSGYVYGGPGASAPRSERAMHAWVECLLPGAIWRGFDPTNNLLANDHYVKVHVGRDYGDIIPTHGTYRGTAAQTLRVDVDVQAEHESLVEAQGPVRK